MTPALADEPRAQEQVAAAVAILRDVAGEAILGHSQFGQAQDAWGNRFLSWNTIPVRHVLLEESDVSGCAWAV